MPPPEITHADLYALLERIEREWKLHKQAIEGAFLLDDRGLPDYAGHNREHSEQLQGKRTMDEYKKAVTLRLLQGGVGLLLTLVGLGLGPFVREVLGG